MLTIYISFISLVSLCFLVAVIASKNYKPEDAAAMKRTFSERYKTIETLTTPEQFEILKLHIHDDAMRFRLVVSPDLVNVKVKYLLDAIEHRTDQLYGYTTEIDVLYNFKPAINY